MSRISFIGQRLLKGVFVLLGILILNFILIRLAPGDPAAVMAGESGVADELFMAQLRAQFGLDEPIPVQLWSYISNVVSLDLGMSYRQQRPVMDILLERTSATLLLTCTAFVISLAVGVFLGILAAVNVDNWADSFITVIALLFYAMPLFWVGLMGVLIFSVALNWLPAFGMQTIGQDFGLIGRMLDVGKHLILPALTLGLFHMAVYARLTRSAILEVRDLDFVRTARAKGLTERRVVARHILRNAILPVISLAGVNAGTLIGGSVIVETVFGWPGIGRLAYDAVLQRDYNLLLGVFFLTSIMVIVLNIITDIIYTLVDPRIEAGGAG